MWVVYCRRFGTIYLYLLRKSSSERLLNPGRSYRNVGRKLPNNAARRRKPKIWSVSVATLSVVLVLVMWYLLTTRLLYTYGYFTVVNVGLCG